MADIISLQSKHLIHGFFEGYKIVIRILKLQVMTQGFDQNTVKLILKEFNFTSWQGQLEALYKVISHFFVSLVDMGERDHLRRVLIPQGEDG